MTAPPRRAGWGARPLADPGALEARRARLAEPHVAPLAVLAARLRAAGHRAPDADPADAGIGARVLLLLETPGPSVGSTGLVSLDNPTGTAANLERFLAAAGLARADLLLWNAVPFVIHAPGARNRAPKRAEVEAGLAWLPPLLALLPRLRVAVLAGATAARAAPAIQAARPGLPVLRMPHPSPTIVCTSPAIGARIGAALVEAARVLTAPEL